MTAATDLRTIAVYWRDLTTALSTTGTTTWPPAGRMSDYLRDLDRADEELAEAARWQAAYSRQFLDRNPNQVGATRPPLRIDVLDTMRTVEQLLVETADATASAVQRPSMSLAPRSWPTAEQARRNALARADAADGRRWRYTGNRTAPRAALWLLARIQGCPGPFRPLNTTQQQHIATVARRATEQVTRMLDIASRTVTLVHPHDCGGLIQLTGGSGAHPAARCTGCGHTWTSHDTTAA